MNLFREYVQKIQQDKQLIFIALSLFSVMLMHYNIASWNSTVLGVIVSVIFFGITIVWSARVVAWIANCSFGWSIVFGGFFLFMILGLVLAIPIDLFRYSTGALILLLTSTVIVLRLAQLLPWIKRSEPETVDVEMTKEARFSYEPHKYLLLALPTFFVLGLVFLLMGRTGDFIVSPWGVIPRLYLYVYLFVTATTVLLLFSKRATKTLLLLIIAHSFLLHAYLPFVYETGFGGDKWRHIASEKLILTGEVYQPALIGDVEYATVGPFTVPAVWVSGNKTSYGHQWASTILLAEMLQIDVFWIDVWLVFVLWSLFLPPLLYYLARFIRPGKHFALLFALLPALFYPLQVFGATTLPVSLGHLLFVCMVLLWVMLYKQPSAKLFLFNVAISLLMFFGYVLHFILIWEVAAMVLLLMYYNKHRNQVRLRRIVMSLVTVFFILLIPALEYIQGYGGLQQGVLKFTQAFSQLADAFGHLTGLVGFFPQPSHVDQGNFLFNQTRSDHAPVSFLSFALWPLLFTVLIWAVAGFGFKSVSMLKRRAIPRLFMWLFMVVMSNYIISWYFMDGNHILARRLDQIIVLFVSVFIALGVMFFLDRVKTMPWGTKVLIVGLLFAFVATSTYASGPTLQVVTKDEYEAAMYVWDAVDKSDNHYCVVANTWPLLAVEGVSGRAIIGGGFPVGFEYAQPERVKIFEKMSQYPDQEWLDWAKEITHEQECLYMNEDRWINERVYNETIDLLGEPETILGDVYIWRF